jgi:hypothetical protein
MEICSNCFKKSSQAYPFCPYCGYPNIDIWLKRCTKGHIIYETHNNCPFCYHMENLGKSLVNRQTAGDTERTQTEIIDAKTCIKNPDDAKKKRKNIKKNEPPDDKTVFKNCTDNQTVLGSEKNDKTRVETMMGYPDKTVKEDEEDKTILDEGKREPLPSFFAWLVYIDEADKPLHDIRLTRQKRLLVKVPTPISNSMTSLPPNSMPLSILKKENFLYQTWAPAIIPG